eukprot:TRINITY_DN67572_c0_g1_i1.p1 TRINITY_DN67572_c0_g1~~TRINITY_DN67572_c0_g1_i1.p1  ORF type:complete len:344 (-),score=50.71 TRINITY_DN67572_c0_g1_i1:14-1045(-)
MFSSVFVLFTCCIYAAADTLLSDQLCQVYYVGTSDECSSLRSSIRAEVRGSGVPTLELGDPSKPPMVFFHGWPDTAAIWANQFQKYCFGQNAPYYCVAPSWIDFHPDYPRANQSQLFWDVQRDAFDSVVRDLKLKDVTFVIFDFGAVLGYQYVWQHPEVVKQVIAMDIGMDVNPPTWPLPNEGSFANLMQYQKNNIAAFKADDDAAMARNLESELRGKSPCNNCRIAPGAKGVGARTGWPYYQFIRSREGEVWIERLAPKLPLSKWKFFFAPDFPDQVPLLFLWSSSIFSSEKFRQWVNNRGYGSRSTQIVGSDHWMQVRVPASVNKEIDNFLFQLEVPVLVS